jgi:hypothetical protein
MIQREMTLAELKKEKRITALDDEGMAISAEIAALEKAQMLAMPLPNIVSSEGLGPDVAAS